MGLGGLWVPDLSNQLYQVSPTRKEPIFSKKGLFLLDAFWKTNHNQAEVTMGLPVRGILFGRPLST